MRCREKDCSQGVSGPVKVVWFDGLQGDNSQARLGESQGPTGANSPLAWSQPACRAGEKRSGDAPYLGTAAAKSSRCKKQMNVNHVGMPSTIC